MRLNPISWNGDARINDGSNFNSRILPASMINLSNQAVYVDRPEQFPALTGVVLPAHSFTLGVSLPSGVSISTQREKLKAIFNILDTVPRALIAADQDNGNLQWQLIGYPVRLVTDPIVSADTAFLITIALFEPAWQSVTPLTDTWPVTSGGPGNQRTLASGGNVFTRPVFAITPTSARTGQYQYSRWVPVYNRVQLPLTNYPIEVTGGGINTATMVADTTVSNQLNGAINNSVTTIPINVPVGGGLPVVGMGYVDTEQISWTGQGGGSLTGVTRGIGGTTAASHLTAAVVARSKVLANGADIAVQVDGNLVNAYVDAPNTTSTKIWIAQTWQPLPFPLAQSIYPTLRTALPNNGTAVTVQFQNNSLSLALLTALKTARNSVFLIDNEAFTFSPANVDLVNKQITSCQRAQKATSFAAHSVGANIWWLEHDIWLVYGNPASVVQPPVNAGKPLLDLHNSTNTSWVQTQFFDSSASRPAAWSGTVVNTRGKATFIYTGNQEANATPSSELGLALLDYQVSNIWKSETATLLWQFYHPVGITTVSMAGSKFVQATGSFPAVAGLQKSLDGLKWLTVWNEAVPGSPASWTAFTHNGVALSGTYPLLRLALIGTLSALANNKADIQGDTVTLTLDNTQTPVLALNQENNHYYLNCTITNTTTGDSFTLSFMMALSRTLTVDCLAKTVTYDDGTNAVGALTPSTTRNDWLTLLPSNNVMQFDDPGSAGLSIVTTWRDRTL